MYRLISRRCVAALMVLTIGNGLATLTKADKPSNEELARRIVGGCVQVEPGDVVVVAGGKHTIPMMEAIAIEVQKAGGMVTMFLSSDRVARSRWMQVPEKYLGQERRFFLEWMRQIDVWIGLPHQEDPQGVRAGVPEARRAKAAKGNRVFLDALRSLKLRAVLVGYPTRQRARDSGLEPAVFETVHWEAVNADYAKIAELGAKLKRMLEGAKTVKVTSPAGTEFSVALADRPIHVNDGVVTPEEAHDKEFQNRLATLPGGTVIFAPLENSANGKVVVPKSKHETTPVRGMRFEFRDGRMADFRAEQGGDRVKEALAAYPEASTKRIGTIVIGLNPALKVIEEEGADFRPDNAAGMVWVGLGNNQLFGGANKEAGGYGFPVTNATVSVDGKIVVKDGKLKL